MHEQNFQVTKRIYYDDSERWEFDATVVSSCVLNDSAYKTYSKKYPDARYAVVLDKTAFFAEGGGQDGDEGVLFLPGQDDDFSPTAISVLYTVERDGEIAHLTKEEIAPGTKVHGRLDKKLRFDRMQQHTGEHIVSGLVNQLYGFNNIGFHLGAEKTTLDFDGKLSKEQIKKIEQLANQAVADNITVRTFFPTKQEEEQINYRSKLDIEGQVRLVEIEGVDICACCAPHTKTTGEVGLIKITEASSYKGGMRLAICCGFRALELFDEDEAVINYLTGKLSVPSKGLNDALAKTFEESEMRRQKLLYWQEKYLIAGFNDYMKNLTSKIAYRFEDEIDADVARRYINRQIDFAASNDSCELKIACIFVGNDTAGYRYTIASRQVSLRDFATDFNAALKGKGGGKPEMILGTVYATADEIRNYLDKESEKI